MVRSIGLIQRPIYPPSFGGGLFLEALVEENGLDALHRNLSGTIHYFLGNNPVPNVDVSVTASGKTVRTLSAENGAFDISLFPFSTNILKFSKLPASSNSCI